MYLKNIIPIFMVFSLSQLARAQPFTCDGSVYFTIAIGDTELYRFNPLTLDFDLMVKQELGTNGMGFNPVDNYIYMFDGYDQLVRVNANGQFSQPIKIDGLEIGNFWAADFSPLGEFILTGHSPKVYRIDVSGPVPVVVGEVEKTYANGTGLGTPNMGDIAFDPISGLCYFFDGRTNRLATLDPYTGEVNAFGVQNSEIDLVGGLVFDIRGGLYGFVLDQIYEIDKSTGEFEYLYDAPPNMGSIDACSCPYYVELLTEVSDKEVCGGDTLIYTFSIINSSQNELEGIRFVDSLPPPLLLASMPSNLFWGILNFDSTAVEITGMTIPRGASSFQLSAAVPTNFDQTMFVGNHAQLSGLPTGLDSIILSDDLETIVIDDPTYSRISPVIEYPIIVENSGPVCLGEPLSFKAQAQEPGDYNWYGPNGFYRPYAAVTIDSLRPEDLARYYLRFINYLGCSRDTFTDVRNHPNPVPNLGPDTSLCLAIPYEFYPGNYATYEWQDGSSDDRLVIDEYGSYWVQVVSEHGCVGADSLTITEGCSSDLYVPNAFSPNGDNVNDVFYVYSNQVRQFRMEIYDRWGEMVFESPHILGGWDGTLRRRPMPAGVYAYRFSASFLNGDSVEGTGTVTLIR